MFFFIKHYKFCFEQKGREKNDAFRPKGSDIDIDDM